MPDGSIVVIQHADVDGEGNIIDDELQAAEAMRRQGATVYIVKKQWQLDRIRQRAERRRGR